jgi:hypothetical protein
MSCKQTQERISLLLDGRLAAAEREFVVAHTQSCRECGARFESLAEQRAMLRGIRRPSVPAALSARLRVLASHERERRLARVSFAARLAGWGERVRFEFDNLMRPVALPMAGGLLSTLLMFALLVPSLSFYHDMTGEEFYTMPVGSIVTSTNGTIADEEADFPRIALPGEATQDYLNVVDLVIDENGKVVDWFVVRGQLTKDMESVIMFSGFLPATELGLPTKGTIRVVQSCPSATVRG